MTGFLDSVEVDTDEDGFHLILSGDFVDECVAYLRDGGGTHIRLRLPFEVAEQLNQEATAKVAPAIAERNEAWSSFKARALQTPVWDDADAYEPNDSKHPGYSTRMADAFDTAKKRARGE